MPRVLVCRLTIVMKRKRDFKNLTARGARFDMVTQVAGTMLRPAAASNGLYDFAFSTAFG